MQCEASLGRQWCFTDDLNEVVRPLLPGVAFPAHVKPEPCPAMINAELRGKLADRNQERREDILTSNVFSFFQYANRHVFLWELLRSWHLDVPPAEARDAEFHYWPAYADGTEPDLVLLVGNYYLLIEAKYLSGFGKADSLHEDQLTREHAGGTEDAASRGGEFRLIAVTKHHFVSEVLAQVPDGVKPVFQWTNWQQIAVLIRDVLESHPSIAPETRAFAEDLCDLLDRKGLRGYAGLSILEHHVGIAPTERVFFDARSASFRGSFLGFLTSLDSADRLVRMPPSIFLGTTKTLFSALEEHVGAIKRFDNGIFLATRESPCRGE